MQAPKNGFFYVLDRMTGEFISAEPYANVSWAKGVDPKTGRPVENPEARYGFRPVTLSPGPRNWAPMSFNPDTGLVYLPAGNTSAVYARVRDFAFKIGSDEFKGIGQYQTGVVLGAGGLGEPVSPPPMIGPEAGRGQRGGFFALDPVTNKERWRRAGGGGIGGGTMTAGNLVFQVIPDGRLVVYSADGGEKLAEIATGSRGSGRRSPICWINGNTLHFSEGHESRGPMVRRGTHRPRAVRGYTSLLSTGKRRYQSDFKRL